MVSWRHNNGLGNKASEMALAHQKPFQQKVDFGKGKNAVLQMLRTSYNAAMLLWTKYLVMIRKGKVKELE